jgi:hypothetical protein
VGYARRVQTRHLLILSVIVGVAILAAGAIYFTMLL